MGAMILKGAALITIGLLAAGCASQRAALGPQMSKERERIYFDFDRAQIRTSEKEKLAKVANLLKTDRKSTAVLEGHTDRIGPSRYNEILAENRARAVRAYLWTLGSDPRQMPMLSKGEREPVALGHTRNDHQLNRRVEIFMTVTSTNTRRKR